MNDIELLELAAKAAGYRIKRKSEDGLVVWNEKDEPWIWNPLERNDDAFVLQVKLNLLVLPYPADAAVRVVVWSEDPQNIIVSWGTPPDPFAATRRAITIAAAENERRKT